MSRGIISATSIGGSIFLAWYIWRNWNFVNLVLSRMVKRVQRLVTGSSEIERICRTDGISDAKQTRSFWIALSKSKDLSHVYKRLQSPNIDVDQVTNDIVSTKSKHPDQYLRGVVKRCVGNIVKVSMFIQSVERRRDVRFKRDDASHERLLESLWALLKPGVERKKGRLTSEWGEIGFQGRDPATDFRGGGLLSLQQLLFIAGTRTHVARRMIREPKLETARYPWACCGIQITDSVLRILRERLLDTQLYGRDSDACMRVFNDAYADIFQFFHSRWVDADPENVLAYPNVFKKAIKDARVSLWETGEIPRAPAQ